MGRLYSVKSPVITLAAAVLVLFVAQAQSVLASCVLKITKAAPCLASGAYGTPPIGTAYGIRVTFNVSGTPKPFSVRFTMANVTRTFSNLSVKAGNGYYYFCLFPMSLDDTIPWSVTLDPDHVSGNTGASANATASGNLTPKPPATAMETYSPVTMHGAEARTIAFQAGTGTFSDLLMLFGEPTTHGTQKVLSVTAPSGSQELSLPPYNEPVYQILQSNVPAGTFTYSDSFTLQLSKVRVNPGLLRKITWDALGSMSTDYTQWINPDSVNESTDSVVANFVQNSLPSNYKTSLTPYDAARTLHLAVMKALTYQEPPPYGDAANCLAHGKADCGGYAAALTACLRNIGIPARRIAGYWKGFGQNHAMVEFYLPGAGWLIADPDEGNAEDPTGTYAYFFGTHLDMDSFVCTDIGDEHQTSVNSIVAQNLQVPGVWYWSSSSPTIVANTFLCYLQPGATTEYTVLLKPTSTGSGIPPGIGYALVNMSSTGDITMTGALPDGEPFTTQGTLGGNEGDQFLVDSTLSYSSAAVSGSLSGALNFVSTTGPYESTATGEIGGTLTWKKPLQTSGTYPAAFQTDLQIYGSSYVPPTKGSSVLPGFSQGTMQLTDAAALNLVKNMKLSAANVLKVTNSGKDKLKLTITPSTGVFNGTFQYPVAGGKTVLTTFTGVLFQDQVNGGGFFLGPNGSGAIDLEP